MIHKKTLGERIQPMHNRALHLVLIIIGIFFSAPLASVLWASEEAPFQAWLSDLKKEAIHQGIRPETAEATIGRIQLLPKVIELDRKQPELKWTLEEYLNRVVRPERVMEGREKMVEHQSLISEISNRYGVPERFLVAFWGIETHYGRLTGGYPVLDAVATLAYEGRRSAFFRKELMHALHILEEGHIPLDRMTGSWAGAMGQVQFMPSSFRTFAVDFDGDGRIDIWGNLGDALASAANYLRSSGWVKNHTWGREVELPKDFDRSLIGRDKRKTIQSWSALGVKYREGGIHLTAPDLTASLVQPDGPGGRSFLVYENFRVILKWNRSDLFAIAVGTLADRIESP
jgi:membrane-bound lytic murein transglycosylase B